MSQEPAGLPPAVALTRMLTGFQLPRAVMVAARLRIGQRVKDRDQTAEELAQALGLHTRTLYRLMRFLAAHEIFVERKDGRFGRTPLSDHLHLADSILWGEEGWATWSALPEALRTGRPCFEYANGAPFFEYASKHPEQEKNWNDWNTATGGSWLPAVVEALRLEGKETIVDVGGGQGNLLAEILKRYPGCWGVLLDLPSVVKGAEAHLRSVGVLDRCELVAGDAFEDVPAGGDIYTISRVLLNWADDSVVAMLRGCARACGPSTRVLVVEILLPEPGNPLRPFFAGNDLNLFLAQGGGHRTIDEMRNLFQDAGLDLVDVSTAHNPTGYSWDVIEGRPLPAAA